MSSTASPSTWPATIAPSEIAVRLNPTPKSGPSVWTLSLLIRSSVWVVRLDLRRTMRASHRAY
jgi:hypothetical protein